MAHQTYLPRTRGLFTIFSSNWAIFTIGMVEGGSGAGFHYSLTTFVREVLLICRTHPWLVERVIS